MQTNYKRLTKKPFIEKPRPPLGATSTLKPTKTISFDSPRKALSSYTYCTHTQAVAWSHRLVKKSCCEGSCRGSHSLLHRGIRHSFATPLYLRHQLPSPPPFYLQPSTLPTNLFSARMMEVDSDPVPQGYHNSHEAAQSYNNSPDNSPLNGLATSRHAEALQVA